VVGDLSTRLPDRPRDAQTRPWRLRPHTEARTSANGAGT
jgi:hypothetical protein